MNVRRVAVVGTIALLGVGVLAGCSSSSGSSSSSTSAAATAAASAAAGGSAAGLPAPVIVTPGQTTATMKVGQFLDIVVNKPAGTTIDVDKPDVLEITQAHEDGGATFNPGAKAIAPGTAVITVTNPDSTSYQITVTVTA